MHGEARTVHALNSNLIEAAEVSACSAAPGPLANAHSPGATNPGAIREATSAAARPLLSAAGTLIEHLSSSLPEDTLVAAPSRTVLDLRPRPGVQLSAGSTIAAAVQQASYCPLAAAP